jgi:hypothetical protein
VTDLGSTKGTFVDGEKLTGERILDGADHSIVLAKAAYAVRWVVSLSSMAMYSSGWLNSRILVLNGNPSCSVSHSLPGR